MIETLLANGLLKENFRFSGKLRIEFNDCERRMNLVKIKNPFMGSLFLSNIFLSIDTKVSKRVSNAANDRQFCGRRSDVVREGINIHPTLNSGGNVMKTWNT